ncbi:hypothetical protein AB6A40_006993 [Gnathostoma spinigerum]|uniref:Uncharacterized protein n=1 Tax=Gnathostoma spinigerum TaxID=75299 RepID=A0ABD6ESL4_9BILA
MNKICSRFRGLYMTNQQINSNFTQICHGIQSSLYPTEKYREPHRTICGHQFGVQNLPMTAMEYFMSTEF